jgi:SAM-dependent methyltransferase
MSWHDITRCYRALMGAGEDAAAVAGAWRDFVSVVREHRNDPPYHLRPLLKILENAFPGLPRDQLVVLDHGCGSGFTVFFLIAFGYAQSFGVDVGGDIARRNRVLALLPEAMTPHFFIYDGHHVPFDDRGVHVVYSQQVLEHVSPSLIDAYYAEEGRVLADGGFAYHQVPHRLTPYESHTRTWLVHYLPRVLARPVYKLLGAPMSMVDHHLFLRTRGFHRRQLLRHIGDCRDVTHERLLLRVDPSYYDGPRGLRSMISRALEAPLLGRLLRPILCSLVMLDTVSVRRRASAS